MLDLLFANPYTSVALLILGFGFLIVVHELGHFLVAKLVGIRATQFAVGFGQALLAYRKGIGLRTGTTEPEYQRRAEDALRQRGVDPAKATDRQRYEAADTLGLGETEYRLNWLPFGGYVKMLGQEDMDPNAQSDDPRSFNRKGFAARAAVISAGVTLNLILGVILLTLAFSSFAGIHFPAPIVGGTTPTGPAATAYALGHAGDERYRGLRMGDRIASVDGETIHDFSQVAIATALSSADTPLRFVIDRPGDADRLTYLLTPAAPDADASVRLMTVGITPALSLTVEGARVNRERLSAVEADSEAGRAGVAAGMTLVELNGAAVDGYHAYHTALTAARGAPVPAVFADDHTGERVQTTLHATPLLQPGEAGPHLLGLIPALRVTPISGTTPAARAGVEPGDVLAAVGDLRWPDSARAVIEVVGGAGEVPLTVRRGDETVAIDPIRPRAGKIGVTLRPAIESNLIAAVGEASPLGSLQLMPGSRLTAVGDTPVASFADAQRALSQRAAAALTDAADGAEPTLTLDLSFALPLPDGPTETTTLTLTGEPVHELAALTHAWGPSLAVQFRPAQVRLVGQTPVEAAALGLKKTGEFVVQTYITLLRLFQGTVAVSDLRGPVGIVDEGTRLAREGFPYYLFFLGLISVNLAVINFLPLPIVDGGLMVFLIVEKLRGKPASPAIQTAVTLAGLVLIGSLFLLVTYHDIVRIVTG